MFSLESKFIISTVTLLTIISNQVKAIEICSSETKVTKYQLIEKCQRSKLGTLMKANVSLVSCQKLGIEKKGLALNFSPPEVGGVEYTCEVLKCAEADGGYSLVNDSNFDYYSIYGKPVPDINSTCVPGIGMLLLLPKRRNFTQALEECRNRSSSLADVASEQRTEALAQLLTGAGVDAVYVGLRRQNSSVFVGDNGKSLDCTTYRAWAPGHPRKNFTKFDCALLSRNRMWLSTPCGSRHPVLCELEPGGPYRRGRIFKTRPKIVNDTMVNAPTTTSVPSDPNV